MRKFRTRKGPPPQRNQMLIQAAREAAAMASRNAVPRDSEVIDIVVDLPPLETPDAGDKPKAST